MAQGFPVDGDWYNDIPGQWPENIDGICVVATEGYVGAYNHLVPFNDFTTLLLKCPSSDSQDHNCYHPGYSYRVSGLDTDFRPLSKASHTIEEVSAAAWNYPLPASPVKKTLTVRDQDEREFLALRGAEITDAQVREILDGTRYKWSEQSPKSLVLCSEGIVRHQDGPWANLECHVNEEWIGGIFHEGYELREAFVTIEEARAWCERHTAMLLLRIEG